MNKWWAGLTATLIISGGLHSEVSAVTTSTGWFIDSSGEQVCKDQTGVGSTTVVVNDDYNPEFVTIEGSVNTFTLTMKMNGSLLAPSGTQAYSVIFSDSPCTFASGNTELSTELGDWPEPYLDLSDCLTTAPTLPQPTKTFSFTPLTDSWASLNWYPYVNNSVPWPWLEIGFDQGQFGAGNRTLEIDVSDCNARPSAGDNTPEPGNGNTPDPSNDTIDPIPGYGFSSDYRLPTVPSPQTLPDTGSSNMMSLMGLGLVLLAAGVTATARSRRSART